MGFKLSEFSQVTLFDTVLKNEILDLLRNYEHSNDKVDEDNNAIVNSDYYKIFIKHLRLNGLYSNIEIE